MPFHPVLEAFEGNLKIVGHGPSSEKQHAPHFPDDGVALNVFNQCNRVLLPDTVPHALARISAHRLSWLSHAICVLPSLNPPLASSLPLVHRRCLDNTVADLLAVLVRGPAAAALVFAQDTILSWPLRACSPPRSASRLMDEQTLS